MKQYKVRRPTVKSLPVNKASLPVVLAGKVRTSEGQLIARAGTEVTEKILYRLRNFGIKRIPIQKMETSWVTANDRDHLGNDEEVIEQRTIEEGKVGALWSLQQAETPERMASLADGAERRARESGYREVADHFAEFTQTALELDESIQQHLLKIEGLPDAIAAETLRHALLGSKESVNWNGMGDSTPYQLWMDTLDLREQKKDLRRGLMQAVQESPRNLYQNRWREKR